MTYNIDGVIISTVQGTASQKEGEDMIKHMTAHTNLKTGDTTYRVMYDCGRERVFRKNDNWPTSIVKFFTAENTVKVADKVLGTTHYERFEKRA